MPAGTTQARNTRATGGGSRRNEAANGTFQVGDGIVALDTSGGARTMALPPAASVPVGTQYGIQRLGGNEASFVPNGTDTIEGVNANYDLLANGYAFGIVSCNGATGWGLVGSVPTVTPGASAAAIAAAQADADQALLDAAGAQALATQADTKADEADDTADAAQATANTALANAATAQAAADEADDTADAAAATANAAALALTKIKTGSVTILLGNTSQATADLGLGTLAGKIVICSTGQIAPDATATSFFGNGQAGGDILITANAVAAADTVVNYMVDAR